MATKKKLPEERLKMGKPKTVFYSLEKAKELCRMIATSIDGITKICNDNPDKFPSPTVIYEWKIENPDFAEMYVEAKRHQAELLAEEIIGISDDSSRDVIIDLEGNERTNSEFVQRSKLRVDSRKWIAARLSPRLYGDKVQNDTTVRIVPHEQALKELE